MAIRTQISAVDIQIGAVEIKDATTDTRAKVKTDGTDNAQVVTQNTQPLPTGASTSAIQADGTQKTQITDGTDDVPVIANTSANVNLDEENGLVTNSMMFARGATDKVKGIRMDEITQVLMTIDYAHHEIHDGSHFVIHINKDIPNSGTFNVAFTTPSSTTWMHTIFAINVEGEADIKLYENVTSWTGGTSITPLNSNRNDDNVTSVTGMAYDVTISLGTPITLAHGVYGSGRSFGGRARNDSEFILKQNTKYFLLITNQISGAANETNISMEWYEHTSRS